MDIDEIGSEPPADPPGTTEADARPSVLTLPWHGAKAGFRYVSYVAGPIAAVPLVLGSALTAFGVGTGRGWGMHLMLPGALGFFVACGLLGACLGASLGLMEALIRRAWRGMPTA